MLFLSFIAFIQPLGALDEYTIDSDRSRIASSVHYSVVGKYNPIFEEFRGVIYLDSQTKELMGVRLVIKTDSVKSKFPQLDEIAKSKKLLFAEEFPEIVYESFNIKHKKKGFHAIGMLDLHGVINHLEDPFIFEGPLQDEEGRLYVRSAGKWVINRKDYNIIWSKFFDIGGILVGNNITVDWEIIAYHES